MKFIIARTYEENNEIKYKILDTNMNSISNYYENEIFKQEITVGNAKIEGNKILGLDTLTNDTKTSKRVLIAMIVNDESTIIGYRVATCDGIIYESNTCQALRMCIKQIYQNGKVINNSIDIIGDIEIIQKNEINDSIKSVINSIESGKSINIYRNIHSNIIKIQNKINNSTSIKGIDITNIKSFGFFIYRFIDTNKNIIYIGMTKNLKLKMRSHERDKIYKIGLIDSIEVAQCKSESDMRIYYIYYVTTFKPIFNTNKLLMDPPSLELKSLEFKEVWNKCYMNNTEVYC